jgi:hypothetical protein
MNDLRTAWISRNDYLTPITNLRASAGVSFSSLKKKINVFDDAGNDNSITGGMGTDWYFGAIDDVITDLIEGKLVYSF